jgi:hypothetical protein
MYKPKRGVARAANERFSNRHDDVDNSNLAALTEGGGEEHLDAYTKIAGEGARWICVRNHSDNLRNDSIFYTAYPGHDDKVCGLDFKDLWKTWKSGFGKKYNIPTATVINAFQTDAVKNFSFPKDGMRAVADYNLDAE